MTKRVQLGFQSALLVSVGVIAGSFILAIVCWCIDFSELAVILMSLSIVGLISRLWGKFALESVSVEIEDDNPVISVGQSCTTHYQIKNNKLLPLIWLDLCLDVPSNNCLKADNIAKEIHFQENEAEYLGQDKALIKRLAYLGSYQSLNWDTTWTGQRRGVYIPKNPILRSGDGFGLVQTMSRLEDYESKCYVVWPKLIAVDVKAFIQNVFNGSASKFGHLEDLSLLKSERDYIPSDSWKRIDWRTAARSDEIMVKEFETVTPQSFLFVLDLESFEDKEEAISMTASLIFELNRIGYKAGVSLPAEKSKASLTISAFENGIEAAMYALSEIDADNSSDRFDNETIHFEAINGSMIWVISNQPEKQAICELGEIISEGLVHILSKDADASLSFREVAV